ncbi:MAG: hypothetical protein B6I20_06780 [Bacteroidetes bacterium 4572_117]|nr:MAG: hypothetical protein B6I20_06780 [Bacteroidetes bacterium 4572_117]
MKTIDSFKNKNKMPGKSNKDRRLGVGIIFIFIGAVLILSNLGIMPPTLRHHIFSWQMILIAIGLFGVVNNRNKTFGLIMISAGVFFLLPGILGFPYQMRHMFWPAVFLVIGAYILLRRRVDPDDIDMMDSTVNDEDYIDDLNVFGGSKRTISSANFIGGRVTSFFGGSEYNMLAANISERRAVIDVLTIFGGSKITVPADWQVQIDVISIFGGFSDKRNTLPSIQMSLDKILIIKGLVVFGGGEIRNM